MNVDKKLAEWQAEGLLDADAAERIRAHESRAARPLVLYAVGGLGAATVGIGVISVVAANWDGIGYPLKLGVDLLLAVLLAAGVAHSEARAAAFQREALIVIYYLFTLASLALIGQIYQLGTPTWLALGAWSGLTAPLLLLGRSWFTAALWMVGLSTTYVVGAQEGLEHMSMSSSDDLAVTLAGVWPMLLIGFGRVPWVMRERPVVARAFYAGGWALVLLSGALLPFVFYSLVYVDVLSWGAAVCCALLVALGLLVRRWAPLVPSLAHAGITTLLVVMGMTLVVGTTFERSEFSLVGALLQLLFLAALGLTSAQLGFVRAFHLVTALIALRVLIVYFEVFGSMLDTGLGMITGGCLTLLLAWIWKRKSSTLAAQLRHTEGV